MNIVAFGASSSKASINQQLAAYAANQIEGANVTLLDLNDFEMPIYSIDKEKENGIPQLAKDFKSATLNSDGIIVSLAEHNGSFPSAFKNVIDWVSRLEGKIWAEKPLLLLATSPGPRGAKSVLEHATNTFPYRGATVTGSFSLPSFFQNFSNEEGIKDQELRTEFENHLETFTSKLNAQVVQD